jgi:hypothetical protein
MMWIPAGLIFFIILLPLTMMWTPAELCPECRFVKNYCAESSALPEVELKFCHWLHIEQVGRPELFSLSFSPLYVALVIANDERRPVALCRPKVRLMSKKT